MGRPKQQTEDLTELARSILVHTGVAAYCDDHHFLRWQDDKRAEEFAYALGANMVRRRQVRCDPAELKDAIAAEIRDLYDHCPDCPDHAAAPRRSSRKASSKGRARA